MFILEGLIVLGLMNLGFYGVCIGLLARGLYGLSRRRGGEATLIIVAVAPLLYYGYAYLSAIGEESQRAREVASWPRKPVTPATLPQILEVDGGPSPGLAKALVAAGPFQKAFTKDGSSVWYVYERREGSDCPSRGRLSDSFKYWDRPDHCTTVEKSTVAPEIKQPYLRLLLDSKASYYKNEFTDGVFAGSVIELRWSKIAGGELAAFWERPTFYVPVFPPLLTPEGFGRSKYIPGRYETAPDPYTFVLDAVGFGH